MELCNQKRRLRLSIDYPVLLMDGRSVQSQAFFPDLGGDEGTLVFSFQQELDAEARGELIRRGYSLSTFSEPLNGERFDVQSYASMFRDWGWTGKLGEKPVFMR